MQLGSGQGKLAPLVGSLLCLVVAILFVSGCNDDDPPVVVPPDSPPDITLFTADSTSFDAGYDVTFGIRASDDVGLDSAVFDYGDKSKRTFLLNGIKHFAPFYQREYGVAGFYTTTLTVFDKKKQTAQASIEFMVYPSPDSTPSTLKPSFFRKNHFQN